MSMPQTPRRMFGLAAALIAGSLALAGCSGSDETTTAEDADPAQAQVAEGAQTPTAEPEKLDPLFIENFGTDDFPEVQHRLDVIYEHTLGDTGNRIEADWAALHASAELICAKDVLDNDLADDLNRALNHTIADSANGFAWSIFLGSVYRDLDGQEIIDKTTKLYEEVAASDCLVLGDEEPVIDEAVAAQKLAEFESQQ